MHTDRVTCGKSVGTKHSARPDDVVDRGTELERQGLNTRAYAHASREQKRPRRREEERKTAAAYEEGGGKDERGESE